MKGVEKVLKKTLSLVSPATVGIISDQLNFGSRASGDTSYVRNPLSRIHTLSSRGERLQSVLFRRAVSAKKMEEKRKGVCVGVVVYM